MSFTDDAVKAKLINLNETQESIVTVAQWVMFHRRHAERTAQVWLNRLSEVKPADRVNLVYLVNEVAQQSRQRRKEDFVKAFGPILPDGIAVALHGADRDIQTKISRVVEVWRQRQVFDPSVQDEVEKRAAELIQQAPPASTSGGITHPYPSSLQSIIESQNSLANVRIKAYSVTNTQKEYQTVMSASASKDPHRDASKLSSLVKKLSGAESIVSEVLEARRELIGNLKHFLHATEAELSKEESSLDNLKNLRNEAESKRGALEQSFLTGGEQVEIARPEMERFTPPPVEALTPPAAPLAEESASQPAATASAGPTTEAEQVRSTTPDGMPSGNTLEGYMPSLQNKSDSASNQTNPSSADHTPSAAALPGLSQSHNIQQSAPGTSGTTIKGQLGPGAGFKRRKTGDDEFDRIGFGAATQGHDVMEGLDEEVISMLG